MPAFHCCCCALVQVVALGVIVPSTHLLPSNNEHDGSDNHREDTKPRTVREGHFEKTLNTVSSARPLLHLCVGGLWLVQQY